MTTTQLPALSAAETKIELAYDLLKQARNLLAEAEAPKTLARVRLALTSCQGARRHAANMASQDRWLAERTTTTQEG
jgi:hypothetical protein